MKNFTLENIRSAENQDLSKGVFVILFNATNIPPHLLISIEGKIYSITDSGRQLGSSLEKLVLFIKRKNVPTVFVEWMQLESWKVATLESLIRDSFLKYDRVVEGKISCLFPIRAIAAAVLGAEMMKANFIFELFPLMEKKNALGKVFELNMGTAIVNSNFNLLTYSDSELRKSILEAKKII